MTSKERILTAIRLKKPDRVPVSPFVTPQMVENMSKKEWKMLLYLTDVFFSLGLEQATAYAGQEVNDRLKTHEIGNTVVREICTPKGILTEKIKRDKDSVWLIEPFFKNQKDIDKFLSIPYKPPQIDTSYYFNWEKRIGNEGLVWLFVPSVIRFPFSFLVHKNFI